MDTIKYLNRIGYTGSLEPTLETLSSLQESHLFSIPFENLDIHNNVKIDLDNSFDKVVSRNRGGFCYELNGLFYGLLKELGYNVKIVSARVIQEDKGFGAEFDHMVIIASIDNQQYLVDVGFGEFAYSPLNIILDKEISDTRSVFKIEKYDDVYKIVKQKSEDGSFVPKYIYSDVERVLDDFKAMCIFHQTSNDSHFTQNRICSLPIKDGRITLSGNTLITTSKGKVESRELTSEEEIKNVLKEYFKIQL
ncbi:MAG: arylamine N-acetyltransferase [Candidatus Kapaibacterium sp.]